METSAKYSLDKNEKIKTTLDKIYNLPALPDIITEALRLLNNKKTSNQQLVEIISKEQSFVAKILSIANSPIYGLSKEVSTLDFAIMLLGHNELRHIIFVVSFLESFRGGDSKYFDQNLYWLHSLLTAKLAKRIAQDVGYGKSGEAFIAGFLHDFGVSISHRYFKNTFIEIREYIEKEKCSFVEAERIHLGITHSEIGGYLMERWNLPVALRKASLYHHNPIADLEDPFLPSIIHVADYVAGKIHSESLFWEDGFVLDKKVFEVLRVSEEKQADFISKYENVIGEEQDLKGLII